MGLTTSRTIIFDLILLFSISDSCAVNCCNGCLLVIGVVCSIIFMCGQAGLDRIGMILSIEEVVLKRNIVDSTHLPWLGIGLINIYFFCKYVLRVILRLILTLLYHFVYIRVAWLVLETLYLFFIEEKYFVHL